MKTYAPSYRTAYVAFAVVCVLCLFAFTGCQINGYQATEVHRTMSFPMVFKDTVHAEGISKETAEDGTVKRKAKTLTHEFTLWGFERNATYKDATLKTEPEADKK